MLTVVNRATGTVLVGTVETEGPTEGTSDTDGLEERPSDGDEELDVFKLGLSEGILLGMLVGVLDSFKLGLYEIIVVAVLDGSRVGVPDGITLGCGKGMGLGGRVQRPQVMGQRSFTAKLADIFLHLLFLA